MKQAVRLALLAGAMALASSVAYAAPEYCGPDGTYTDTATDPDSVLNVNEVTLNGANSDDCYGVVESNDADLTLWGNAWVGPSKSDDTSTFLLGSVTFDVNETSAQGGDGTWELILTGDPDTILVDLMVVLKAGSQNAAYLFDDILLEVPSDNDGAYIISFFNNGGQTPDLSHIELYARDLREPPTQENPAPGSLLLIGLGLAGLAVVQRRRRRV